jgi:hypothetical protein
LARSRASRASPKQRLHCPHDQRYNREDPQHADPYSRFEDPLYHLTPGHEGRKANDNKGQRSFGEGDVFDEGDVHTR